MKKYISHPNVDPPRNKAISLSNRWCLEESAYAEAEEVVEKLRSIIKTVEEKFADAKYTSDPVRTNPISAIVGEIARIAHEFERKIPDRYGLIRERGRADGAGGIAHRLVECCVECVAHAADGDPLARGFLEIFEKAGFTRPNGDEVARVLKDVPNDEIRKAAHMFLEFMALDDIKSGNRGMNKRGKKRPTRPENWKVGCRTDGSFDPPITDFAGYLRDRALETSNGETGFLGFYGLLPVDSNLLKKYVLDKTKEKLRKLHVKLHGHGLADLGKNAPMSIGSGKKGHRRKPAKRGGGGSPQGSAVPGLPTARHRSGRADG